MTIGFRQRNRKSFHAVRMEPLAKLPVFWDLAGKPVLVVGNSEAAAWKAELVAACGADVHVYLGSTLPIAALLTLAAGNGQVSLHQEDWCDAGLSRFALAIADCDADEEAARFHAAARNAGVPVNVIDKPDFCQFQFGSIVNRSPVVIAISTDGAAPILAQAIRRRVEAVLPPALAGWAALAQRLRSEVCERLAPGAPRRRFWERFVDRTFAGDDPPDETTAAHIRQQLQHGDDDESRAPGTITYVGAGPGDPDMLTLKAMRALQSADVILADGSISADVLRLARREAKRISVADALATPAAAADHAISLARQGCKVIRLIAGDLAPTRSLRIELDRIVEAELQLDMIPGLATTSGWRASVDVQMPPSASAARSRRMRSDTHFPISAL